MSVFFIFRHGFGVKQDQRIKVLLVPYALELTVIVTLILSGIQLVQAAVLAVTFLLEAEHSLKLKYAL